MEMRWGDWVRTDSGEVGRTIYIAELTAFVQLIDTPQPDGVRAYLTSSLTVSDEPAGRYRFSFVG